MTLIETPSLQHPSVEIESSETKYKLHFIKDAKAQSLYCSEAVYAKLLSGKYAYKLENMYTLHVDPESNMVVQLDVNPRKNFYPNALDLYDETKDQVTKEGSTSKVPYLILYKDPNNKVTVKYKPDNIAAPAVNNIVEEIQKTSKISQYDFILNKYIVADIRDNSSMFYIDVTPR